MSIVLVPKYGKLGEGFNRQEIAEADEHPGRKVGSQSAASWVMDLVSLKKVVILCSFCRAKFNPRKFKYRKFYKADVSGMTDGHVVNGKCDSCKESTALCGGGVAFIHEEEYSKVCIDPMEARRNARASAKSLTAWQTIDKERLHCR